MINLIIGHFTAEEWNEEKKTFAVNYETGMEVVVEVRKAMLPRLDPYPGATEREAQESLI